MGLFIVHDEEYCYRVAIQAHNHEEAIEKLHKWFEETKQNGEFFKSKTVKWIADRCDNDIVIK